MEDIEKVMGWLEGLTFDDWRDYHSDSEVSNTAKAALELLKEYKSLQPLVDELSGLMHEAAKQFRTK